MTISINQEKETDWKVLTVKRKEVRIGGESSRCTGPNHSECIQQMGSGQWDGAFPSSQDEVESDLNEMYKLLRF